MRRTAVVVLVLVAVAFTARSSAQNAPVDAFVRGEILVKFQPGAAAAAQAEAHRQAGGTRKNEIALTRVQVVSVGAGDEAAAIARYRRNPNVLYAEPNFIRRIPSLASHPPGSEILPGDHYFDEQWALHNTGQLFFCIPWIFGDLCFYVGTPDADIDAPEAWAVSTGSTVTVAVLDTGIDYNHPDLMANYAGGQDFATPDLDPMDDHGHGTHVSATIAASLNNPTGNPAEEEGVVGVAPHARIRAYKVCKADGTCDDAAIQQGIIQAVADGAKVINMSFGGPTHSQSTDDAIQAAWAAGVVIVASAGNSGVDTPSFPASNANVIAVGASDEDDLRASFSNFGSWVDIAAPGNVIISAQPLWTCGGTTIPGDTGCYTWMSGTSMASPHVAGAAALVWSRSDVTSNSQVRDILFNSADPRGVSSTPINTWTAHGRLNIHNAMSYGLSNLPPAANAGPDQSVTDANSDGGEFVTLNGTGSSDPEGAALTYEWSEGSNAVAFSATPSVWLTVGVHTLTLEVTDDQGATGTDSVTVTVNGAPPPSNLPPVANAGPDQTVTDTNNDGSEFVALNATASSDPEGGVLAYEWSEGSTLLATGATPTVVLAVGPHTLTLRVTDDDGAAASDSVTVTVNAAPNLPPVANAGPDQTVTDTNNDGSELVTLNGAGSSDPESRPLTYEWTEGSTVVATGATPAVSLAVGAHTLTLKVTDDRGATGTDSVNVTVNPAPNVPPSANAGPDQTVTDANNDGGEFVSLNGTGSSDPEGRPLTYEWKEGSTVVAFGATPSVWLTVGAHTLTLKVTDDRGATGSDVVNVTVNPAPNAPPTANAGPDQAVTDADNNGSELIALNGTASSDPEGGPLTYEWSEGTMVVAMGATPSVVLTVGAHTLTLKVTDNRGATGTDTVAVTVNAAPAPPPPATLSVTGISPNVVSQNAGVTTFVITGTGFATGASVSFVNGSGPTPRVVSVVRNSSTQLTAVVEIKAGGPRRVRQWDVAVTNPGGPTAVGAALLTVNP